MGLLLLPFKLIWTLACFLFSLMGRFISLVVGIVLMIVGVLLTFTVVGAIIGIPLIIIGCLLMIRSVF